MHNPSLTKESRYEPAAVIPLKQDSSLLDWLAATGRLISREQQETENLLEEEMEISELMEGEDHTYDDDDRSLSANDGDLEEN